MRFSSRLSSFFFAARLGGVHPRTSLPPVARTSARLAAHRSVAAAAFVIFGFGAAASTPALTTGCLTSVAVTGGGSGGEGGAAPVVNVEGDDPSQNPESADAIEYRSLEGHPGCNPSGTESRAAGCPALPDGPLTYTAASIPGYRCAAKAIGPAGDPSKPVLILVHGNSDQPSGWERYPLANGAPQLAESASSAGFTVIAADFRFDLGGEPTTGPDDKKNAGQNIDHGYAVPIAEHLFESVMKAYPSQQISIVGFSLGPTVIRDALRRMHRAKKRPFERIKDLVLGAGSNHGVSTYRKLCNANSTMAGKVACELGDRAGYQETAFLKPLNGGGAQSFETPCLDGETAFGQKGVCGGHKVRYTTIVMKDAGDGNYADEFVSEASSRLEGANNLTVPEGSNDVSGYFCGGLFKNHYGAVRSPAALEKIMTALTAP